MNKQILAVVIIVIIGYSGFGIGAFYLSTQQPGLPANTNSQPTNSPVGPTAQLQR
jgi:hypothetical protein